MKFDIRLVPSADGDLDCYRASEQKAILSGISRFLETDADVETPRRKKLRPNPLAPWELRLGDYRVFYEIPEEGVVRVLAVGHKRHSELLIRRQRVEI